MVLNLFVSGTKAKAAEVNQNIAEALNISGKNLIRTLQDRAIVYSKGQDDFWAEAYIDVDGRMDSINGATITSAYFVTNKLTCTGTIELNEAHGLSMPSTVSDTGKAGFKIYCRKPGTITTVSKRSGCTATTAYVTDSSLTVLSSAAFSGDDATFTQAITAGTEYYILSDASGTYTKYYSSSNGAFPYVQPRCSITKGYNGAEVNTIHNILSFTMTSTQAYDTITHAIPTGTFSSTILKAFGTPLIADWETGADIKYKLTNATEDTGWLNCGITPTVSPFTAFTSQPTSLIVQLIPKASSPTAGFPAIYGFAVRGT